MNFIRVLEIDFSEAVFEETVVNINNIVSVTKLDLVNESFTDLQRKRLDFYKDELFKIIMREPQEPILCRIIGRSGTCIKNKINLNRIKNFLNSLETDKE